MLKIINKVNNFLEENIIKIQIKIIGEYLQIIIEDNGIGIDEIVLENLKQIDKTKYGRVGISNVKKRLELFYGNDFKFDIQSKKMEFTKITIIIPAVAGDE